MGHEVRGPVDCSPGACRPGARLDDVGHLRRGLIGRQGQVPCALLRVVDRLGEGGVDAMAMRAGCIGVERGTIERVREPISPSRTVITPACSAASSAATSDAARTSAIVGREAAAATSSASAVGAGRSANRPRTTSSRSDRGTGSDRPVARGSPRSAARASSIA